MFVRLFKNNISVSDTTVLTDFIQCDYDGYTELNSSTWTGPTLAPNGDEIITSPIFVFQHGSVNGTQNAYGYYVVYKISGTPYLLCAETFEVPYVMNTVYNQVPVPIQLNLRNLAA